MAIYVGSEKIGAIYVGQDKIGKIYVGSELVYQSGPSNLFPSQFYEVDGVTVYNGGLGYKSNYRFNSHLAEVGGPDVVSGYLYVYGKTELIIAGCENLSTAANSYNLVAYNANHEPDSTLTTQLGATYFNGGTANGTYTIPAGTYYIRFTAGAAPTGAIVTLT